MNNIVYIRNKKFFKTQVFPVLQKGKTFFVAIMPAKFLIETFTVDPVVYDLEKEKSIRNALPDLSEYLDVSIDAKQQHLNKKGTDASKGFQRHYDEKRVKQIADFIIKEDHPFFPNSIIATCDLMNDVIGESESLTTDIVSHFDKDSNLSFLEEKDGTYTLFIPFDAKSILIIDGQHRLEGLRYANEKAPLLFNDNEYNLIVSFVLEFNRSIIAKLFYTINYTQKSVNKSVLYHLTGEFSTELDEVSFLHEVVKFLNELKDSPFEGRIKILGAIPPNTLDDQKIKMTISQAFLIDYLMYTITNKKSQSLMQPIFYWYYSKGHKETIAQFILSYFKAVKTILPQWNNPNDCIISKSVGVGALLKVMNFYFLKKFTDNNIHNSPKDIANIKSDKMIKDLTGLNDIDWDTFSGQSSAGTLNKIRNELIENIDFFGANNYETFANDFKINYSIPFSKWLRNQIP